MAAKKIMIQGTMSNSGKSFITAGLCRVFAQDGYKTAPFKSQNMALNSYITRDGLEIGRAQAMQAEAAGIEPSVFMNPILLKPTSHVGSQVIVNGVVAGNWKAVDYYKDKTKFIPDVKNALAQLEKEYDIIVIEGAGSPAEINLKENDLVNMGLARIAKAPVLLAGDIDRGGVFASLYGTIKLLEPSEQQMIKGLIINKFRGDLSILDPGLRMIEAKTNKPILGVIPMADIDIDDEDSLSERLNQSTVKAGLDLAVIHLPHLSNFTDFRIFECMEGISLRYVKRADQLGTPDLIIVPGTKNTMDDLMWMRECGLETAILRAAEKEIAVIGICGGFQMLGKVLSDPLNVESGGSMRGLGLLDVETTFMEKKTTVQVTGSWLEKPSLFEQYPGSEVTGYEIHMGETKNLGRSRSCICLNDGRLDGFVSDNGLVFGTYLHGLFDTAGIAGAAASYLADKKGISLGIQSFDLSAYKEQQYDKLADLIRNSVDMARVYEILEEGLE